jgi:hypothetical protein
VILPRKKPVIHMQWIDWDYMESQHEPEFDEVIAACDFHGLKRIMAFKYNWCAEIIAQCYATV